MALQMVAVMGLELAGALRLTLKCHVFTVLTVGEGYLETVQQFQFSSYY